MAVRNVEYIISLRDNFSKQLASINKNLQVTGRRIQSIGKTMSLAVTLPIVALGATAVKLASDFEETESKFFTVFSSIQNKAADTAKNLKDNFGLSSRAALQLLGDTGDLLVGFGFTESAALEMSKQVNELAVDLASFTNVQGGAQSASAALTKALLGERESVKTLGISILESDVKARVLLNTQKGLVFESNRQAKAVATLQIATEQSSKAIGDFERTSESFANQMRITRARLEDLGIQIGKILLPLAQKFLKIVKGWIQSFSNLSPETKKTIVVIAGLVAILGPLLLVLGVLMTTVIPGLITAFGSLNAVMLLNPVLLIVAGVVALTVALVAFDRRVTPAISKTKLLNDANIQAFKSISTERIELQRLIRIAKEETLSKDQRRKAIEKINAISPKFLGNITLEEINTKKTSEAIKEYTKSILLKSRAQAASNRIVELEGKVLDLASKKAIDLADIGEKASIKLEKLAGKETTINRLRKLRAFEIKKLRREQELLTGLVIKSTENEIATEVAADKKRKGLIKPILGVTPVGVTKIVSAAPKIFNINIEKLVETINNNVTNLKEGMNESKKIIVETLLSALNETQALVR